MTDKEFNKFDKHYNNLVKKGTIKTMNDACIYKLAIEEAIKVMHSCKSDSEQLFDFLEWFNNYCTVDIKPNKEDVELYLSK